MTLDEVRPFGDRVLVKPDPKVETFAGGLIQAPQSVLADNPNYYTVSGVVVKLGAGYREDVYECLNQQCRYQTRRTVGEYCPVCKATQKLLYVEDRVLPFAVAVGDRVLFGRFAGKQIEIGDDRARYVMLREVEITGIVDGAAELMPGYQAANFNKASKGLTPEVTTVPR